MKKLVYILLALVLTAGGCSGDRSVDRQLAVAEELIADKPASAVSILMEMDTASMSQSQVDRQSLLYVYAHAIHGYPLSIDDDVLRQGDSIYSHFDRDGVRWLMIKSVDAKTKGNAVARIENLKDAEFMALQLDSKFELALIYQYLANVYEQGFNGTVSRYFADRSVDLLRKLNYPKQLREARMAVFGALVAQRDYKTALDSILAMNDEVMANADNGYKIYFLDQLAGVYDENDLSDKAIEIWDSIYSGVDVTSNTLAHWARAYCRIDALDSAYTLIQRANSMPHNATDEYLCRNVEYQILEKMGRKSQLAYIDSLRDQATKRIAEEKKLEESSLAVNQKYDSATKKAWIEAADARHRTNIAVCIALIIALAAVAVYMYFRKRNRLLRLEHENDVLKIRTLQDNLFESDARQRDVSAKISEMFQSRFSLIDSLAASYFECKETGSEHKRIYAEVKKAINNFGTDAATKELENIVNAGSDNLMEKFRGDFTGLSVAQYRLALYLFCGFSLPAISIFTGSDIRNIYVYKSRLKALINKSDCQQKEEYLVYFG